MASKQNGPQPSSLTPEVVQALLAIAQQQGVAGQHMPAQQHQPQTQLAHGNAQQMSSSTDTFDATALGLGMQPSPDLFGGDSGSWSGPSSQFSSIMAPGDRNTQRSSSPDFDLFSPEPAGRNTSSSPYTLLPPLSDVTSGPTRRVRDAEIIESDAQVIGAKRPTKRARTANDPNGALSTTSEVAPVPDNLLSPYRRPVNVRSVELFSGPSKQIFVAGEMAYQLWVATKGGFPDRKAARDQVDKIFRSQIDELLEGPQRERRRVRLQNNPVYRKDGQSLIRRGATHIRGEIIRLVCAKGPSAMGFGGLKKDDIKTFTSELLGNTKFRYNYHFGQLERQGDAPGRPNLTGAIVKRSGAYRHPLIAETLATVFFLSNDALGIEFPDSFNPMPLVPIALVAAAMECVVDEWSQGFKATYEFSKQKYGPVFDQHLAALESETTKPQNRSATDLWLAGLYVHCRSLAKPAVEDEARRAPLEIASDEFAWDDDLGPPEDD